MIKKTLGMIRYLLFLIGIVIVTIVVIITIANRGNIIKVAKAASEGKMTAGTYYLTAGEVSYGKANGHTIGYIVAKDSEYITIRTQDGTKVKKKYNGVGVVVCKKISNPFKDNTAIIIKGNYNQLKLGVFVVIVPGEGISILDYVATEPNPK